MKSHSLRQRWIRFSVMLVATVSVFFAAYCVVAVYVVEDALIDKLMQSEFDAHQLSLPAHHNSVMRWYNSLDDLPLIVRQHYHGQAKAEFAGDEEQHFHVRAFRDATGREQYLVAEVSSLLVVRPMRSDLMLWLAGIGAAMLLLSVWFSYRLTARMTQPLQQLSTLLSQLKSDAQSTGFDAVPPNEVGEVIVQLDRALQRIQHMVAKEQQFSRDVSHELRTPLAVINTTLSLLQKQVQTDHLPLLARMQDAVTRINQDLSVLLALAREQPVVRAAAYPVLPLIEQCVIEHAARLRDKPIDVSVQVTPTLITTVPEAVMRIVLSNLISNAFIYCEQGQVCIGTDGAQVLTVSDTGPGIRPASTSAADGLGIGLTIVQRLCASYGIACEWLPSQPNGTVITLRLPT